MQRTITFFAPSNGKMRDILRNRFSARFCTFLKGEEGRIVCDGTSATGRTLVTKGQEITVRFSEEVKPPKTVCPLPLSVLYEDEDLIAVHKPRGVASLSTFGYENSNVISALFARNPNYNYHVVTRLDKDTEGVVLVAKSGVVHSLLQSLGGELKKIYLARGEGVISKPFTVDAPIARGSDVTRVISLTGQRAITRFAPISIMEKDSHPPCTLVAALPVTGRTHQIRLHLAYAGHAAVGDTLYGRGVGAYNSGQNLACYLLCFPHPVTGERVQIVANWLSFMQKETLPAAEQLLTLF